jgi:hypothetical protein
METLNNDSEGYKSPPATVTIEPPKGPYNKTKIKLDENHTCPVCNGRGYIQIVNENVPRKYKRDVLGKLIGDGSASG